MSKILKMKNVAFAYSKENVLEDVNFQLEETEFVGIIGPNGGGKTTLLKLILGLEKPGKGKITLFGKNVEEGRINVGYVPQYLNVDFAYPITVLDAVMLSLLNGNPFKKFGKEEKELAGNALDELGVKDLSRKKLSDLSGGQRQRVLIARAIVNEPKLLLMDEPTASIDKKSEHNFFDLLAKLNKRMAIVLVSHDIAAISSHVKSIACLNKKMVYHGSAEIPADALEKMYPSCHIDLIGHGKPHRVLREHDND